WNPLVRDARVSPASSRGVLPVRQALLFPLQEDGGVGPLLLRVRASLLAQGVERNRGARRADPGDSPADPLEGLELPCDFPGVAGNPFGARRPPGGLLSGLLSLSLPHRGGDDQREFLRSPPVASAARLARHRRRSTRFGGNCLAVLAAERLEGIPWALKGRFASSRSTTSFRCWAVSARAEFWSSKARTIRSPSPSSAGRSCPRNRPLTGWTTGSAR